LAAASRNRVVEREMSESGFASLGPKLLARKGGARPAMRPQLGPAISDPAQVAKLAEEQLEDLGWNDMGDDDADADADAETANTSPIMRRQQRRLEERVLADAVMTGREEGPAGKTRRTAFTLRLDRERHLKLRLAATIKGISAQVLVTEALDSLLAEFNELDGIAARIQRH
jgi:hypothetical protein